MDGFFTKSELMQVRAPRAVSPRCGACGLYKTCNSPKMPADGKGRAGILVVGEAPGREEDDQGRPFVGRTGELLRDAMADLGIDLRSDCWLYNAVICRPKANKISDYPLAVGHCSPNVERTIKELKPKVIILLGGTAIKSVVGRLWKGEDPGGVSRWVGWRIPAHAENCWIAPTYHPSFLLRMEKADSRKVHERLFRRHLKAAVNKMGSRPWPDGPPNYLDRVEVLTDTAAAARRIRKYTSGVVAFDYENDRLKPDHAEGRFVSASVCWEGVETIAFPWHGDVIEAMKDLLRNPDVGKIASNLKHEHRWTLARLGVRVRGWKWDTMLAAHALDSRGGISSIKFQAFVRLGQPDYAHHIEEFLRPRDESKEGGNAPNQIHTVPMDLLLQYCGLDSLLEYEVAMLQMKELGCPKSGDPS